MYRGGAGSGGLWAELQVGCELRGFAGHWTHPPPFLLLPVASVVGTGPEPREKWALCSSGQATNLPHCLGHTGHSPKEGAWGSGPSGQRKVHLYERAMM